MLGKSYKFHMATNHIVFFDEELSPEGIRHIQASTLLSNPKTWYIVAIVFTDQGSSLNPLSTLHNLKVDCAHLRSSTMIVPEFNDTKGEVFGEINPEVEIGLTIFKVFQDLVVDVAL